MGSVHINKVVVDNVIEGIRNEKDKKTEETSYFMTRDIKFFLKSIYYEALKWRCSSF